MFARDESQDPNRSDTAHGPSEGADEVCVHQAVVNRGVEAVRQITVRWGRPEAADGENDGHRHRIDHGGKSEFMAGTDECCEKKDEKGEAFGQPGDKEEPSDAFDVGGLEFHVRRITHLCEKWIVHVVDRPDEADHEPRCSNVRDDNIAKSAGRIEHAAKLATTNSACVTEHLPGQPLSELYNSHSSMRRPSGRLQ